MLHPVTVLWVYSSNLFCHSGAAHTLSLLCQHFCSPPRHGHDLHGFARHNVSVRGPQVTSLYWEECCSFLSDSISLSSTVQWTDGKDESRITEEPLTAPDIHPLISTYKAPYFVHLWAYLCSSGLMVVSLLFSLLKSRKQAFYQYWLSSNVATKPGL